MGLLTTSFLYSLLCSLVPCDFYHNPPETSIAKEHYQPSRGPLKEPILKNPYPIVETNDGSLRGYSMGSTQGNQIFAFEGIRFGESTAGQNRFKPPVPSKPWKGVRAAHKPGPPCLQTHPIFIFRVVGSEDCLFLNIYTTNLQRAVTRKTDTPEKLLPVIVFIHGGIFYFGEGAEYGPAYLVDRDVLLVTINYRLSVMGFLSTGDDASPGNYGLKDQALALKWISENIKYFGGDPEKITIMGQSAGGCAVHLHLYSNKTRDYFRSAISLSGPALAYWAIKTPDEARKTANRLARIVGCPSGESHMLVNCFRNMNPHFLVGYTLHLFRYLITPIASFPPVIEPKSEHAFLSDSPEELYARDEVAKYPLISTITSGEGHFPIYIIKTFQQWNNFRRNLGKYLPVALEYDELVEEPDLITERIKEFYFGSESPETAQFDAYADLATDRLFTHGIMKALNYHSRVATTYSYIYNYRGHFNIGQLVGLWEDEWGVGHIEDVVHILNATRYYEGFKRRDPEYKVSRVLTSLIANFATKGEPFLTDENGNESKIWDPIDPHGEARFLLIDNDKKLKMIDNPFVKRVAFWESLGLNDTKPFLPQSRKRRR